MPSTKIGSGEASCASLLLPRKDGDSCPGILAGGTPPASMAAEPSELEELDPSHSALCAVGSLKVSFWGSTGPAWCSVDETETVDLSMSLRSFLGGKQRNTRAAGVEITVHLCMTLNFWPSCLRLLRSGVTSVD